MFLLMSCYVIMKLKSIWDWASSDLETGDPDIVMACCGDVPTLETLAAVSILRKEVRSIYMNLSSVYRHYLNIMLLLFIPNTGS